MEAMFWESLKNKTVKCTLCPHKCRIPEGRNGICKVRANENGRLISLMYNKISSIALDPIEKKPLYHFYPSSRILSAGSLGCNFSCQFCQNYGISKPAKLSREHYQSVMSDQLLSLALKYVPEGNIGLAYTYNEPTVWYEFMLETAKKIRHVGLKNVVVTNGFMNPEPLEKMLPFIDAFNVDIKSINPVFYEKYCQGRLKPVLDYCKIAAKSSLVEITNLVIPTLNDTDEDFKKLSSWVARNLGKDTPLHFSAYKPNYKMTIDSTEPDTLIRAREIAMKKLNFVYLGNVYTENGADTLCPECANTVVKRDAFTVQNFFTDQGNCPSCGYLINIRS